ncbi:MAG TPA: PAS domain-containing sensor histidine kinase, partial [Candidatus Acidoferrum sp.]|nr:PAS domain-containing sensor histidine kinase [Candidatus Acidoferrum sp.]
AKGLPEWLPYEQLMSTHIACARAACRREQTAGGEVPVAVYSEMLALLLQQSDREAVVRLERFENRIAESNSVRVLCAYPIEAFNSEKDAETFLEICDEHLPVGPDSQTEMSAAGEKESRAMAFFRKSMRAVLAEVALRRDEQRFRLFVEAVQDYALFLLDAEGRVSTWNKGAQRIKGYEAHEIIGKHFSIFYPEEDVLGSKPQFELEIAAREGRFEDEGWRVRKDGSKFWANVIITALRDENGTLYGFGKVTRDFTERMLAQEAQRDAQRKLEESEKSLRELSLHQFRTQEEERRRIGVELHDSLGQNLSFLKMTLDSTLSRLNGDRGSPVGQTLAECAAVAEEAIKEVRTISYLLYPPMLEEMGLKSAVSWYIEGFAQHSGIDTQLSISPGLGRFSRDVETTVFRILQEALTNIHRHSGSATANVRLAIRDGDLELEVSDQGKGIVPSEPGKPERDWTRSPGVGLRGMNERIRQLGGKLELMLTPVGTTVRATVPADALQTVFKAPIAGGR